MDLCCLGAAQVDGLDRTNVSVIGDRHNPKVRLPDRGGGAVMLPTARRAVTWRTEHSTRTMGGRARGYRRGDVHHRPVRDARLCRRGLGAACSRRLATIGRPRAFRPGLVVVVVSGRTRRDPAIPEAPFAQSELLRPMRGDPSVSRSDKTPVLGRRDAVERSCAAVKGGSRPFERIHDQRRASGRHHPRALIRPIAVVRTDVSTRRQRLGSHGTGRVLAVAADGDPLFESRRFFRAQKLLASEIRRALQRGNGEVVPDRLQVRIGPGRTWYRRPIRSRRLGLSIGERCGHRRRSRPHMHLGPAQE